MITADETETLRKVTRPISVSHLMELCSLGA